MSNPIAVRIQQEQWFRTLVEHISDAIVLLTSEGTVLYLSPSVVRVTGYTPEERVGMNGFALVHPDDLEYTRQRLSDLLDHPEEVITMEYRLRHKDGAWRWLGGTANNLLHDPTIGAIVVNFRDITERKQAEEERSQLLAREQAARMEAEMERHHVEELNRQLEAEEEAQRRVQQDFLSMVSHELRTPLQSIMGFIDLTLLYSELLPRPLSPEAEELIGKIEVGLKRAMRHVQIEARLVEELLDVSWLERHTFDLALQECNLVAIVQGVVAGLRQAAPMRRLELAVLVQKEVSVMADARRIEQVLTNYLVNALRYSPADQDVLVLLAVEGHLARVSVRDRGPGLTPEQQQQIWERFYQAGVSGHRGAGGGLGLGLTLVKAIVEQHGGQVGVESHLGQGSTFWFTLPLADDAIQA
jgi:PAS domain S-box-containing protein